MVEVGLMGTFNLSMHNRSLPRGKYAEACSISILCIMMSEKSRITCLHKERSEENANFSVYA